MRVLGIGTEWTAATRKCSASRDHRRGRDPLLNPVDDRAKQIKLIKPWTTAAMCHSGNKIKLAPLRHSLGPAICSRQVFEIAESIQRPKPRIAVSVIKDQLSSVLRKSRQVCRHRVHERLDVGERFLFNIYHRGSCRRPENAGTRRKNAADGAARRDAGIVKKTGIHLDSAGRLWTTNGLFDRRNFLWSEACLIACALASQHGRIKITSERV